MLDLLNNDFLEETPQLTDLQIPSGEELMQKADQPIDPVRPAKRRPVPGPMTMDEAWTFGEQLSRATNPYYGTGFTEPLRTPEKYAKKYLDEEFGFHPAVDNEDFYAQRQGGFEKIGKGLLKLPLLIATKTGSGIGFIGGLLNPANMFDEDGYIAAAADNAISKTFNKVEEYFKNDWFLTSTFQEAKDRNKGFFARAFTDIDFWTDDTVDALAFLVSAYIPGTQLAKLNLAMKLAKGLSGGRVLGGAAATIEGLETVPNYLRYASTTAKGFNKTLTWGLATGAESMVEAKGVKDYLTEQLKNDYTLTEEQKKDIISGATRNTFLINAALLGFTNFFEMRSLYKLMGKTEGVAANIASPGLGQDFVSTVAAPITKLDRFLQSPARIFLTGAAKGIVREGFIEENGQLAIQRLNQQYGLAGKVATVKDLGELGRQYLKQTYGAVLGPDTAENRETSLNIGLGGIIGGITTGIGNIRQRTQDNLISTSAMQALNQTQSNWMKFGNIYKTEVFEKTGADGKMVKSERIVMGADGKPQEDIEKINAITASFTTNIELLNKADKESVAYKASIMRDMAFTGLVQAHIDANMEDSLFEKLDDAINAKPEDLINLGFDPQQDYKTQIQEYKTLAGKIVDQNRLISQDILFDNTVEDQNRKAVMIDLAAKQAVYDKAAKDIEKQKTDFLNKILNKKNTSITDSLVDQLNAIQYKIDSLREVLDESEKSSIDTPLNDKISQDMITDLIKEKEDLLKDNELSAEKLKKPDSKGYYKYEHKARNNDPMMKLYLDKVKLQSQIENSSLTNGLKFALLADAKNGKQNFTNLFKEEIEVPVQEALKNAQQKRDKDNNLQPAKPSAAAISVKVPVKTAEGAKVEVGITEGILYQGTENGEIVKFRVLSINEKEGLVTIELGKGKPETVSLEQLAKLIQTIGFEPILPKVKGTSAKSQEPDTTNTDENELDPEIEEESEFEFTSASKPRFEDIGFNKTFGRHYTGYDDRKLNDAPGSSRFFEFTGKHNLTRRGYALEVITAANDRFRIRQVDLNPDDIKVVVVKKQQDADGNITYSYVDKDNKLIPAGQETKDNIIYRSLANRNDWTVDRVRDSYAVGSKTTSKQIQKEIDDHKQWQIDLENRVKEGPVYLTITRTSPGVQAIVRTDQIGENRMGEIAKFDMEGRVIQDNPDYTDLRSSVNPDVNIKLRVATADGAFGPGIKAGRVVMQEYNVINGTTVYGDKLFRVFNRSFDESEKDNLARVIARLSELYNKKFFYSNKYKRRITKNIDEKEEKEIEIINRYLKGVINWKSAKSKGKINYKTFWVENGLHRGSIKVKFDPSEIIKNKEVLFGKDPTGNDAFHHVNNTLLLENEPFVEVKIVSGKAIESKKWDSYQEYLIAKRQDNGIPPVYTSLPRTDEPGRPQRTNVYIEWRDPSIKEEEKEQDDKEQKATGLKFERTYTSRIDQEIDRFLDLRANSIKVRSVSFWIEKTSDGYQIKYKRKAGIVNQSQIFRSANEFRQSRSIILKTIQEIANYRYGATKKITEFLNAHIREEAKAAETSTPLPDDVETYLKQEYDKVKAAAEAQGRKILSFISWRATAGRGIVDRYNRLKADKKTQTTLAATQKAAPVSDIKAKKAEIEYNRNRNKEQKNAGAPIMEGETAKWLAYYTPEKDKGYVSFDTQKEALAWIDSKYDAELAALEGATSVSDYKVLETFLPTGGNLEYTIRIQNNKTGEKGSYTIDNTGRWVVAKFNDKTGDYEIVGKPLSQEQIITSAKTALGKDFVNKLNSIKSETDKVVDEKGGEKFEKFLELLKKYDAELAALEGKPVSDKKADGQEIKHTNVEDAVKFAILKGNDLSAIVYNEEGNKVAEAKVTMSLGSNIFAAKNNLKRLLISQLNADIDEAPFRFATAEQVSQTEDFQALQSFLEKYLPQFVVKRMAHLIGGKAWGQFKKSALYIYQNAEIGTGFHEAFEGVWTSYLTDEEKAKLSDEFRSRPGKFTNPFSKITKEYSEASNYDIREMLAEEFRDYMLNKKQPAQAAFKSFFKQLLDFIKGLFGLNSQQNKELEGHVNTIFKNIATGIYRNAKPIREQSYYDTPVYRAAITDTTVAETSEILDGLNYYFFTELLTKGSNINSILSSLDRKESNALLKDNLEIAFSNIERDLGIASQRLVNSVRNNKEELYDLFKKNLQRYGVNFESIEVDEIEVTDTLGIRESITIDPRKATDVNVMILLASLPETSGNKLVRSLNTNLPKLVDADRVHTILLNELSNIVSIIGEDGVRKDTLKLMFDKLDNKFVDSTGQYRNGFGWIKNLKRRLRYEDTRGNRISQSSLPKEDLLLQVAFTKSFSNTRFTPSKIIIEEEGNIYDLNPLMNVNNQRIKRNWNNNLQTRLQSKKSNLFRPGKNGELFINKTSDEFFELQDFYELSKSSAYTLLDALSVLNYFGIQFSASPEQLESFAAQIREDSIQILNSAVYRDDIKTASEIFGNEVIGGRINKLINLEMSFNTEDNVLSYLNADGQPQYSVGIPSLWGNMVNIVNNVRNQKELVLTCPWLGYLNENDEVVFHPYQSSSELLKKGGLLFDKDGKRKPGSDIIYHVISGTGISEVDGKNTAKLLFPERVAIKIHYLLNNIPLSVINSDKNTEYGIGIPGKPLVKLDDIRGYTEREEKKIVDLYLNHLSDELHAAQQQAEKAVNIQYYSNGVVQLGHFQDIISDKLKQKFKEEVFDGDKNYTDFVDENKEALTKDISDHISRSTDATYEMLMAEDIFTTPSGFTSNRMITNAIDNDTLNQLFGLGDGKAIKYREDGQLVERDSYSPEEVRLLSMLLTVNEDILTTEQHKLIYGHPSMYKELPKRANGATSTKEAFVEDNGVIQWMDGEMSRNDGKIRSKDLHQTMRVISFKDLDVVSLFYKDIAEKMYSEMLNDNVDPETASVSIGGNFDSNGKLTSFRMKNGEYSGALKYYLKLNEADSMAMGMPDIIRDILFMSSKFTPQMEAQWNYEIAYEKLVRSGIIEGSNGQITKKDPQYKSYNKSELADSMAIYKKGSPGYIFPMLKPQYFGYGHGDVVNRNFSEYELMIPKFLKHAVQPKFYRHVEGTKFEKLYLAAQTQQVDIIGFESGEKVGNVTNKSGEFISVYDNQGDVNLQIVNNKYDLPKDLPIQSMYSRFYGIQVEQSSKPKKHVVRGTQVTKIIMSNFYENGLPLNEEIESLIEEYNDTLIKMFKLGKQDLLKEFGLEVDTKNGGYRVRNLQNLVNLLRSEAENRDLPDNVIEAINYNIDTKDLDYQFDMLINRDKIDNILNAIVDSRVISEKVNGKSSTQAANTLYEFKNRSFVYLKDDLYVKTTDPSSLTEKERASLRLASSDLNFYRMENGQVKSMEVYIGWPYTDVSPEELGLKLINGIYRIPEKGLANMDKRLLNLVCFRIPTQAPNSIESVIVKGFLPPEAGDIIVVPSEIVGKTGSDFDIDKLNLYMPKHEVAGPDYASSEFRDFMVKDLVRRGIVEDVAKAAVAQYTTENFKKINRATFTESGRLYKNAPFSLESLAPGMDASVRTLSTIKESIQNYNKQFKGKKILKYVEPSDTSKEGLQNKMIEIMSKMILRPENYSQLVSPNTTITLKTLATRIRYLKIAAGTKTEDNEKSSAYLRSFAGAVSTRERYLTSKRLVGISALHTTFHTMAQVAGIKLTGNYKIDSIKYLFEKASKKKKNSKKEKIDSIIKKEDISIKLDHHQKLNDGTYAIGYRTDTSGKRISDLNSEGTSGFVDGWKDPFVFDLNLSLKSANTWFYLMHMGVPVEQIAYLFSQPIMDSYFTELAKRDSNFKKINNEDFIREDMFFKVIAPYYDKLTNGDIMSTLSAMESNPMIEMKIKNGIIRQLNTVYNSYEKFDVSDLKQAVADGEKANPRLQIATLMAFLRYETQARFISNFMQAISYDTNKTKTIQESVLQVSRWERSRAENFIANPDDILNKTFLGELKTQKEDVFNMFQNFFITLDPTIQEVFKPLYAKIDDPDIFITKNDGIALVNRYQNHVLNYILHTTKTKNPDGVEESLNQLYDSMFFGETSMANRLYELRKEDINADPRVRENLIVQELLPLIPANTNDTGNIKLFRQRLDTFEVNKVIEAMNNLHDYAEETGDLVIKEFVVDLAKFSILQSGLNSSYMDYKKVLSTEIYSEMLKEIFSRFNVARELDVDQVWKTFHQNNWYNKAIVPKAPSWIKIKDNMLAISQLSSLSKQDFYTKSILNPALTKEEVKRLKKSGRGWEAFVSILFQRTNATEKGKVIYMPINKMGAGNKLTEIYSDSDATSVIESNNSSAMLSTSVRKRSGFTLVKDLFPDIFGRQEEDDDIEDEIDITGFKGYKFGFIDKGKGTIEGDGKDAAMREVADGFIGEIGKTTSSSTLTSANTILKLPIEDIVAAVNFTKSKVAIAPSSLNDNAKIIMLARNKSFREGKPLSEEVKEAILKAKKKGAEFVVGDMPNVDSQFIDYLLEIGATFTVYHTGPKGSQRIFVETLYLTWSKRFKHQKIQDKDKKTIDFKQEGKPMNSIRKLIEESNKTGEDIEVVLERKKKESKNCNKQ